MAATKADAENGLGAFEAAYAVKYLEAVEYLKKDREALLAFYDFPAEPHLLWGGALDGGFQKVTGK